MFRKLAVAACMLLVAACVSTSQLADLNAPKPPAGSKILIVQPDVELSTLTMAGLLEPRADWSQEARDNLVQEVTETIKASQHEVKVLDPSTAMDGRNGQLLRLNEAVITSITSGYSGLPTKKGSFNWTIGEGAKALGETYGADYALFTYGRGSYSSGGRKAAWLVMAAAGVSLPMGSQTAYASLVDLKTGQVVWYNITLPSTGGDLRSESGAEALAQLLLKNIPL
jgi:hypothetical protein